MEVRGEEAGVPLVRGALGYREDGGERGPRLSLRQGFRGEGRREGRRGGEETGDQVLPVQVIG